ncbi:mechanosensitive ion channel [Sulfitobacter sp. D35]|uniref:mechanosensitive ion channel family protein n=1 Tax=Sulfitobacter sp. D35 TaxID=3083252 RepID=UPI00296E6431|nr:mechanosensitive ion channel domain-containing protein [Sulfitobacter sp. D35]MDW4497227.1 mechanosensitive ion channel [Sulfitobacter sp. D35]
MTAPLIAQESSTDATAEDAVALPDPLTPEAIDALVARLSDDQVRGLLLEQLNSTAEAAGEPGEAASFLSAIQTGWEAFYTPILAAISRLPVLLSKQAEAFADLGAKFGAKGLLLLAGLLVLSLGVGLLAEYLVNLFSRRWQTSKRTYDADSLWAALSFLFRRFCRELLGLIAFYFATRATALSVMTPEQLSFAAPFLTYLIWFPRLAYAASRFILAPETPHLRLVNVSDHWAKYLTRNLVGLVLLGGFTLYIIHFNNLHGVPLEETRIGFWANLAVHVYIALIAWRAREGLQQMMRGSDPDRSEFDEQAAFWYPRFAIAVSALMWVVVTILTGLGYGRLLLHAPHYSTMFWLLMVPAIDTAVRGLVRHLHPPMLGEGKVAERAFVATKRSYVRIGRVVALTLVVLIIANAWGLDLLSMASATEDTFASNLVEFVMVAAVGYILFEVVSLYVNRRLAKEQTSFAVSEEEQGGEGGGQGGSRLVTVLPLVRIASQIAIVVIFALLAIGSLGIDITPLLAGAGILGLAIGFGAQKLVTDVVSGIFFLLDDAFRVGEYVEVDGTMGTVEKISVRSMQLRHHRGLVHTIPYGEIPKLTNFSRDWVIMKLKFTVPFDTDPNKVKKIFKKIGQEMIADPMFKDDMLEPFKSQGVFDFDDVGMIIRGKFMAKPGTQFTIRKEVYNRVKAAFNEAGIDFARREVRVNVPGLEQSDLTDEQKQSIAAAATSAAQQQDEGK